MTLSPAERSELQGWLRAKGLTLSAAAELLDWTPRTLSDKLAGKTRPLTAVDLVELGIRAGKAAQTKQRA